ncbi:hypothetical protein CfE428DRAFT_6027 [Chthoniobacter flavus Ellin428]|uniref:Uncharacterized protein n=1 Tax=Chthoniobacter flavus Ellin428 TaxID=497964 RepID=B4DAT6_9BACT|nr:hypothetical protein [Chthoniobacter flavus]EDY16408.1 hypothetical protein CfE428DRAFT_6027 [Chthoniobacter flavus Ellin428]TCO81799.1 hypothetical protein EV701_1543 [Chthoniobacter flavus]
MAFRLDDLVIAGVFYNTRPFCVHGRLLLRGEETPILVELTGIPAEDLRGRGFEFEVPRNDRPATDDDRARVAQFRNQQIGAVGTMTAALKRKTVDGSTDELNRRSEQGEPPPVRWCRCLYLEWFSQNGRVVVELAEPRMRFVHDHEAPSSPAAGEGGTGSGAPESVASPESESETAWTVEEIDSFDLPDVDGEFSEEAPEEEGYGLVPDDLNRELEQAARRLDREITAPSDDFPERAEWELLDDLIEKSDGTLIENLLREFRLPPADAELTDHEAALALRTALAHLALFGVAFHICEHCSIREAYRIFQEKVCLEGRIFPEMRGTSFVQHYMTSDYCERCQNEL